MARHKVPEPRYLGSEHTGHVTPSSVSQSLCASVSLAAK